MPDVLVLNWINYEENNWKTNYKNHTYYVIDRKYKINARPFKIYKTKINDTLDLINYPNWFGCFSDSNEAKKFVESRLNQNDEGVGIEKYNIHSIDNLINSNSETSIDFIYLVIKSDPYYTEEHGSFKVVAEQTLQVISMLGKHDVKNPILTKFNEKVFFSAGDAVLEDSGEFIGMIKYAAHFVTGETKDEKHRSLDESKSKNLGLLYDCIHNPEHRVEEEVGGIVKIFYTKKYFIKEGKQATFVSLFFIEVGLDGHIRHIAIMPNKGKDWAENKLGIDKKVKGGLLIAPPLKSLLVTNPSIKDAQVWAISSSAIEHTNTDESITNIDIFYQKAINFLKNYNPDNQEVMEIIELNNYKNEQMKDGGQIDYSKITDASEKLRTGKMFSEYGLEIMNHYPTRAEAEKHEKRLKENGFIPAVIEDKGTFYVFTKNIKTFRMEEGGEISEDKLIYEWASRDLQAGDSEDAFYYAKALYPNIDKNRVVKLFNEWIEDRGGGDEDNYANGGEINKQPDWLFIGQYPNAIIYADKTFDDKESKDYHQIARVILEPIEIKILDNSPKYKAVIEMAKKEFLELETKQNKMENEKFYNGGEVINDNAITADPSNLLEEQQIQNPDITSQRYVPKSIVCEDLDTTAPVSMLYDMNKSLTEIDRKVRGIDDFVMKKLGYDNLMDMCRSFGAEQVDGIANAIYQIEQGHALIIGDMTGVGKGRIAAGVIRYAKRIGKTPIFFTEKPNLFTDIYRDLIAIGSDDGIPMYFKGKEIDKIRKVTKKIIVDKIIEDIDNGEFELDYNTDRLFTKEYEKESIQCIEEYRELYFPSEIIKEVSYSKNPDYDRQIKKAKRIVPFIVNSRSSSTEIKDEDGNIIYESVRPETKREVFAGKELPKGYDSVVITYSQVNSPARAKEKIEWLTSVANDAIVIFDESQNASGSSQTGKFLQNLLNRTAGVCYLSATFAKRPDNMPIYAMKTAIQDAEMDNDTLIEAILSGGVALQEILSSDLVSEGQMLRRERSYEGVIVNYNYLDERMLDRDVPMPNFNLKEPHEAISDKITDIIRRIISFQKDKINTIVSQKDEEFKAMQAQAGVDVKNMEGGINNPPVFSGVFNLINQLLFSIKADAVADFAIMRMKEGKKVVIGFSSTLESFLDYLIQDESDKIKTDFSIIMKRRLEKVLEYTVTYPNGDKEKQRLDPDDFPTITEEYYSILEDIQSASTGITISPIDRIVSKIKEAGFSVGEVTGRKKYVQFFEDGIHGAIKSRVKHNANDLFRKFNDNEIDCLLINQAGATGASAQALKTKKAYVVNHDEGGNPIIPTSLQPANEVKQRCMIILQAELDVNKEVQKRGRINRTGQVFKPIYDYVISGIPAEERLMMMLQKKLKSLDANTTSNQKQSKKLLDVVDFLNIYGDTKVVEFMKDNPSYNDMTGNILKFEGGQPSPETERVADKAHRVSGRVAILPVELQSNFYRTVSDSYQQYELQLRQTGEWNLEVESMNLDAKTVRKDVVSVGNPEKKSVFGGAVFLEKCLVNNLRKPHTKAEMEALMANALTITTPEGKVMKYSPEDKSNFYIKKFMERMEENKKWNEEYAERKRKEDLEALKNSPALDKKKTKAEKEDYINEKEMAIQEDFQRRISSFDASSRYLKQTIVGAFEFFQVRKLISYPMSAGEGKKINVMGLCLGIDVNMKTANPFAPSQLIVKFVMPNGLKLVKFSLSDAFVSVIKDATVSNWETRSADENDVNNFIDNWDETIKEASANRVHRNIVTGNILKGYGNAEFRKGGKLISYTVHGGGIKKGILLSESLELKEVRVRVPINKALNYLGGLRDGNVVLLHRTDVTLQKRGMFYNMSIKKSKNADYVDIVNDADINSFAWTNKWDLKKGMYENRFEEPTLKSLVKILGEKYKMSVEMTASAFESIKDQFDVEEREHSTMDGTEELIKKHNKLLDEYERSKAFKIVDDKELKKLDDYELENYELKKRIAELEAFRRLYKLTAMLENDIKKRKREALQEAGKMKDGGKISNKRYGIYVFGELHDDFSDELLADASAHSLRSIHPEWKIEVKSIKNKMEDGGYIRHADRPVSEQVEIFKTEGKVFFNLDENYFALEGALNDMGLNFGDTSQTGNDIVVYNADIFDSGLRYLPK